jgi:hypothetical protein
MSAFPTGQRWSVGFFDVVYYCFSKLMFYISSSYYGIGGISGSLVEKMLRKL